MPIYTAAAPNGCKSIAYHRTSCLTRWPFDWPPNIKPVCKKRHIIWYNQHKPSSIIIKHKICYTFIADFDIFAKIIDIMMKEILMAAVFFFFIPSYFYSSLIFYIRVLYIWFSVACCARASFVRGQRCVLPGGSGGRYEAYEVRTLQTIAGP